MIDFAQTLRDDPHAAIRHIGTFAMKTDPVHETMYRTAKRLDDLKIPYAVCGGMALALHGYARATVDVDLLRDAGRFTRDPRQSRGTRFRAPVRRQ